MGCIHSNSVQTSQPFTQGKANNLNMSCLNQITAQQSVHWTLGTALSAYGTSLKYNSQSLDGMKRLEIVFGEGKTVASSFCCFQTESTVHYGGGQRKLLGVPFQGVIAHVPKSIS